MNNKTYANYLMHGRTKGSRNGISTTKGYTAVGQKAKGHLVNGKYVYDTPVAYGNNTEMIRDGKVVYENPSVPTGVASYPKKKSDWAKEAASYDNHVTTYPKQGYDALMMEKRNAWLAEKAKAQGASNNWQQQAALERWKQQNRDNIAAKKKKAEAFDKASDAYRLGLSYPVADEANRTRTVNEHYNKNWKNNTTINYDAPGSGSYLDAKKAKDTAYLKGRNAVNKATMNGANTNASQQAELERWKQQNRNNIAAKKTAEAKAQAAKDAAWNAKVQVAKKPTNVGASQAGNTARAMKEYMTKASADRKAQAQAAIQAAKQPTNIGASQSADLARWKQQNRNNIAASKKAALKEELRRNAALNKHTTKDWQNKANIARANTEVRNKVVSGESNKGYTPYAEPGRVSNGIADEKTRNLIRLENLQNRVYAEQNKKAQEATEKAKQSASYNKMSSTQKNAMQNDPRYTSNKQETAKAQAGNKAFMNAFEESKKRNSRSDIGNAIADAKEDAKNAFKALKKKLKKKK